jgi:hypothetical protein
MIATGTSADISNDYVEDGGNVWFLDSTPRLFQLLKLKGMV